MTETKEFSETKEGKKLRRIIYKRIQGIPENIDDALNEGFKAGQKKQLKEDDEFLQVMLTAKEKQARQDAFRDVQNKISLNDAFDYGLKKWQEIGDGSSTCKNWREMRNFLSWCWDGIYFQIEALKKEGEGK